LLLEEIGEARTVLVRWESTRTKERVSVLSVRQNLPSRRCRKTVTNFINYDERVKADEENRKSSSKKRGKEQPGQQKQKAPKNVTREEMSAPVEADEKKRKSSSKKREKAQPGQKQKARTDVTREAMSAPASAMDDIDKTPSDSFRELKKLHREQECYISVQHENSKMDDIPSPTVEVTITIPKKHKRPSRPIKKRKREDCRDDEPSMSAPPRGLEVELMKIQEEELSSGRAAYFLICTTVATLSTPATTRLK
jgi:hypothetical protein